MGREKKHCDECGQELIRNRCCNKDCGHYDPPKGGLDDAELEHIVASMSLAGNCYYFKPDESLVFTGVRATQRISVTGPSQMGLQFLLDRVVDITGRPDREINPTLGRRLLRMIHDLPKDNPALPWVESVGNWPVLQQGESEWARPHWPEINKSDRLRYLQAGYYYTGPAVVPERSGAFDEWLSSTRCADGENRQTLKEWLLGTMLVRWYLPGSAPALLLCATQSGIGKTETAKAIGALLGGFIEINWNHAPGEEALHRRIMAAGNRMVLVDNLSPKSTSRSMLDFGELAALFTRGELTVKTLYNTTGSTGQKNYYSYVLTANVPLLTPELLNRCAVVTLSDAQPRTPGWLQWSIGQRERIMADMLATIIEDWTEPAAALEEDLRWDTWGRAITCVTGQEPKLQRGHSALIQPFDWLLTRLWINPMSNKERLVDILAYLNDPKIQSRYQSILGQDEPTYEAVKIKLQRVTKDYALEVIDGAEWVVRRQR